MRDIPDKKWSFYGETIQDDYNCRVAMSKKVKQITNYIRGKGELKTPSCSSFRKIIKRCPGVQAFHTSEMQDAGEFLGYLFNIYQIDPATTSNSVYLFDFNSNEWIQSSETIDNRASPIVEINPFMLTNDDKVVYSLKNALTITTETFLDDNNMINFQGKNYNLTKSVWRFISSTFLIFNIHRLNPINGKYNKKKVEILEKIQNLYLTSIVLFRNMHYTCLLQYEKEWYFYNDMIPNRLKKIGNFFDMVNSSYSPQTDGTIFFYMP